MKRSLSRHSNTSTSSGQTTRRPSFKAARALLKISLMLFFALAIGCVNQYLESEGSQVAEEAATSLPMPTATPTVVAEESASVEFSLDSQMVGTLSDGAGSVYVVEYRGYPNYRILRFDEGGDGFEVVFQVPQRALVYAISLSADKQQLLLAFTQEVTGFSNGIYTLDLTADAPEPVELLPEVDGIVYSDIEAAGQNTFWATKVESRDGSFHYTLIEYDNAGNELQRIANATNPVVEDGRLYFLQLDDDDARRTIGSLNPDGSIESHEILGGDYDLNLFTFVGEQVYVSVLDRDSDATTSNVILDLFSSTAAAHGNHNTPASWVLLNRDDFSYVEDVDIDAKTLYDAITLPNGQVLELSVEGLELIDSDRNLIVKSRAFRLATN